MIRLGGHGLPIDPDDPEAFARAHVDFGYRAPIAHPSTLVMKTVCRPSKQRSVMPT